VFSAGMCTIATRTLLCLYSSSVITLSVKPTIACLLPQ